MKVLKILVKAIGLSLCIFYNETNLFIINVHTRASDIALVSSASNELEKNRNSK